MTTHELEDARPLNAARRNEIFALPKYGFRVYPRLHRGGGFGLEVPWEYIFEGDDFSYERLHRKLIECLAMSSAVLVYKIAA